MVTSNSANLKQAFLSVPLRHYKADVEHRENAIKIYLEIKKIIEQRNWKAYLPSEHTDPVTNIYQQNPLVYKINYGAIEQSQLLVAYVGIPSNGVGAEMEIAAILGVPIIVLYEELKKPYISAMSLGNPNVIAEVSAESFELLPSNLDHHLNNVLMDLQKRAKNASSEKVDPNKKRLKERLEEIHKNAKAVSGLSTEEIANRAGIDRTHLYRVLKLDVLPERDTLIKLCFWGWHLTIEETRQLLALADHKGI